MFTLSICFMLSLQQAFSAVHTTGLDVQLNAAGSSFDKINATVSAFFLDRDTEVMCPSGCGRYNKYETQFRFERNSLDPIVVTLDATAGVQTVYVDRNDHKLKYTEPDQLAPQGTGKKDFDFDSINQELNPLDGLGTFAACNIDDTVSQIYVLSLSELDKLGESCRQVVLKVLLYDGVTTPYAYSTA